MILEALINEIFDKSLDRQKKVQEIPTKKHTTDNNLKLEDEGEL